MQKSFRLALWFVCIGVLIGVLTSAAPKSKGNAQSQGKTPLTVAKLGSGSSVAPCTISTPSTPIAVGQTLTGQLSASDCTLTSGQFADLYRFSGVAGQQIAINLNSSAFDTYLFLLDEGGASIIGDDDGGGGTNSRIPPGSGFFTLPATGNYIILANSFAAGETGGYTLSLAGSSAGPSVVAHMMSGGPISSTSCDAPPAKFSFATTDALAYQWTSFSGIRTGDVVRRDFISPNGSIFFTSSDVLPARSDNCAWDSIPIAGNPAASLPGNWQVRVYYNGAQILTENFTITQTGSSATFAPGDIFVSINNGRIQWRRANGTLVQTLDTGEGGFMTGMAFDKDANLYATSFERNKIHRFSPAGLLLGIFGSGFNNSPESIVFDRDRNVYVGQADGSSRILKFNADGNLLATFTPAREGRGTDWIELAEDQCTMFYTSEGRSVKRFNVCTNTQLPDFVTRLPGSSSRKAFALRLLPSASGGGLIVGDTEEIVRLDASGNVVGAYDAAGENTWFAINLDPDGKSFWSAGEFTGNVYKFDLATRNQLMSFNTGTPPASTGQFVNGLAIFGEIIPGQADLTITKTASPNPVNNGSNLTYTITVTNKGQAAANSVRVRDDLPAGTTFASCNATGGGVCGGTGNNRTITFNSLASNASATITLVATVNVNCSAVNQITNTATVTWAASSVSNSATASSTVSCDCTYSINPTSQSFPASGGSGSVAISTQPNCAWTAASNDAWIRITSGQTGTGNGSVNFSVEANTGARRTGTMTIAGRTFTVTQDGPDGRTVRLTCPTTCQSGTLTVPVVLDSQGNENALGFSLNFNPAILSNPQVALGSDTANGQLNVNPSQVAQGRIGVAVALPSGRTFTAGARQIAVITFNIAANTTATTTTVEFGDAPIRRQVSDANAQELSANYLGCASITICPPGLEADVAPRPDGNGAVTITDWVQVGRFAAVLDAAATGREFQRADCAPRNTSGDGQLSITDWVQAGRYAASLDPTQPAAGPTGPTTFTLGSGAQADSKNARARAIRALNATFQRGQSNTLELEIEAEGNENAFGLSLNFDPSVLAFVSASVGSGVSNAVLNVNSNQAASGRLGIALALPAGQTLRAGKQTIVTIRFNSLAGSNAATTTIGFGDAPIRRQISDVNAVEIAVSYSDGSVNLVNSVANVSAASFKPEIAAESIVAAFGASLATTTAAATTLPLPTSLAGTTVKIKDSAGVERLAPLFFVAPSQVNYLAPPETAPGAATVTITSGNGTVSAGTINIATVAPSLFAANADGQGVGAMVVLRVRPDGSQVFESAVRFDPAQNKFVYAPIDLGAENEQVVLLMFGTGFRNRSALSAVSVNVGGVNAQVDYAGPQPGFAGLDQINVRLSRSLAGRGEVDVVVRVDERTANNIKAFIK